MGWIIFFVIIWAVVSIVLTLFQNMLENNIRSENRERNSSWRTAHQEELKTDEQIRNEARDQMKKSKQLAYLVMCLLFLVITVFNSFFTTNEQQVAYTMTFGKATVVEGAGIHFKIPFITKSDKFDATTKGMAIGYQAESNESVTAESLMITSDFNFVNTDFYLEYRITNPVEYEFGSSDPEGILYNIAQASIRNTVGLYTVDEVITTGKSEIQALVKEQIIEKLQMHKTGLTIVNVTIQDAEPPTVEVSAAFKEVETAKQNAETAVNGAKKAEKEKLPNAEAEADRILQAAEAAKVERINQATQEVAEFMALFKEYMQNPDTVKLQLYYSMMAEILPDMEIIIGSDSKVIYIKNGQITTAPIN